MNRILSLSNLGLPKFILFLIFGSQSRWVCVHYIYSICYSMLPYSLRCRFQKVLHVNGIL